VSGSLAKRTASAEGTERLGAAFGPALEMGDVLALRGELGAGKTRFVAGLARAVSPGVHVRSPSFTLVNEYVGALPIFHIDLYRLGRGEADGLGLLDYAERGALVVEWGERLPASWLEEALMLAFTFDGGDERRIEGSAWRGRGIALLEAWRPLPEAW
jgi:tRNA threonylcarbamoyladenosine biosynthesis protein TsaE